ncbi:MAG: hypothetical protein EZS28_040909 [Streblomastix strix]|uniref:Uncharacterized protein n=1 Tax=Streblomastix strix TaxID=222440 RepID=A0A5J4TZE4_9EUKA|nr:MAG: hypothetical protein EZS28_040909 [Streblomastix strix]
MRCRPYQLNQRMFHLCLIANNCVEENIVSHFNKLRCLTSAQTNGTELAVLALGDAIIGGGGIESIQNYVNVGLFDNWISVSSKLPIIAGEQQFHREEFKFLEAWNQNSSQLMDNLDEP